MEEGAHAETEAAAPPNPIGALRRKIRAARLKVTLDEQLGRKTSPEVRSLAGMKLPPLVRSNKPLTEATAQGMFQRMSTDELLRTLRREILAAELKVVLDRRLRRDTAPAVKKLAGMMLPPI